MRMRFFVSSSSIEDAKNRVTSSLADIRGLRYVLVHLEKYWKEENVHIVDITITKRTEIIMHKERFFPIIGLLFLPITHEKCFSKPCTLK